MNSRFVAIGTAAPVNASADPAAPASVQCLLIFRSDPAPWPGAGWIREKFEAGHLVWGETQPCSHLGSDTGS